MLNGETLLPSPRVSVTNPQQRFTLTSHGALVPRRLQRVALNHAAGGAVEPLFWRSVRCVRAAVSQVLSHGKCRRGSCRVAVTVSPYGPDRPP